MHYAVRLKNGDVLKAKPVALLDNLAAGWQVEFRIGKRLIARVSEAEAEAWLRTYLANNG